MKKKYFYTLICVLLIAVGAISIYTLFYSHTSSSYERTKIGNYWVEKRPTPNVGKGKNDVQGIILHHTANKTIFDALGALRTPKTLVSSHAVIDTDGTRYILAEPTAITWHAGYSMLNGRERCNEFTIGIEFQGNTKKKPLTEDQINSAIDYILPIMKKYNISKKNIVTHEQVRHSWIVKHPDLAEAKHVREKVDITQKEYEHFMSVLNKRIKE